MRGVKSEGAKLGKYRLMERIGSGGMAEVFRAKHEGVGGFSKELVIKMILPAYAEETKFIDMFMNEAKLAARLDHPNIVHVFDFGTVDGRHFLAMEYVRGLTMRRMRNMCNKVEAPIPPNVLARIMCGVCQGLNYAHDRKDDDGESLEVIHRDVSPDNIIVSRTGTPKLLDFGIARAGAASHTTQGTLKGKYSYMSPEQVMGEAIDKRSDIYACGVVLYEMLAGEKPFTGTEDKLLKMLESIVEDEPTPIEELRPDVPAELGDICRKAMSKKSEDRYQTAQEMRVALENFIAASGNAVLDFHVEAYIEELAAVFEGRSDIFSRPFTTPTPRTEPSQSSLVPDAIFSTNTPASEPSAARLRVEPGSNRPETAGVDAIAPRRSVALQAAALIAAVALGGLVVFLVLKKAEQPSNGDSVAATTADAAVQEVLARPTPDAEVPETAPPDAAPSVIKRPSPDAAAIVTDDIDAGSRRPHNDGDGDDDGNRPAKGNGTLTVRASPYCSVYLDKNKLGDTPLNGVSIPAGSHRLRCVNRKLGIKDDKSITVEDGDSVTESFRFESGKLDVRVKPWGEVSVDGVNKGITPIGAIRLYEGRHTVKITNKDLGVTRTRRIKIEGGRTKSLRIDLTEQ